MKLKLKRRVNAPSANKADESGTMRRSPQSLVVAVKDGKGSSLKLIGQEGDFVVEESIRTIKEASQGNLVELHAIALEGDAKEILKSRERIEVLVNPEFMKTKPHKLGSVLIVDGVDRNVIVEENEADIERMLTEPSSKKERTR